MIGEGADLYHTMLAGEAHRASRPLLLRDPAHLMVERVIDTEVPVYGDSQTVLRRKIGIAHGVLRAALAAACFAPLATTPLHCLLATRSTSSLRLARGYRLLDARLSAAGVAFLALH